MKTIKNFFRKVGEFNKKTLKLNMVLRVVLILLVPISALFQNELLMFGDYIKEVFGPKPTVVHAMSREDSEKLIEDIIRNNSAKKVDASMKHNFEVIGDGILATYRIREALGYGAFKHEYDGHVNMPEYASVVSRLTNYVPHDRYVKNELYETHVYVYGIVTDIRYISDIYDHKYKAMVDIMYEWDNFPEEMDRYIVQITDPNTNIKHEIEMFPSNFKAYDIERGHAIDTIGYVERDSMASPSNPGVYVNSTYDGYITNYNHKYSHNIVNGVDSVTDNEKDLIYREYLVSRKAMVYDKETKKYRTYNDFLPLVIKEDSIGGDPMTIHKVERFGRRVEITYRNDMIVYDEGIYDKIYAFPDSTILLIQSYVGYNDGFIKETPSLRVAIGYALPFWNEPFGVDNAIYFWDHFEDEVDSN